MIIKKIVSKFIEETFGLATKDRISNKMFLKKKFKKIHSYELNLKKPKTFNEKIQYRKVYGNHKFMSLIADKYRVRKYVKDRIGEEYLIPLLAVYDRITVEDLKKLPNQFVIKTNHGSGKNHIEIVRNKIEVNLEELALKMNKALKENFGYGTYQDFYSLIEPKIMVEELLLDNNQIPEDYKFHCFKNKGNNKIFIQVDKGRFDKHKRNLYDENWGFIEMKHNSIYLHSKPMKEPNNFSEMKKLAISLLEDFDYIRVDFYSINGKIYFGELTQTHGNGFEEFEPLCWDEIWGKFWELEYDNRQLYIKKRGVK